MNVVKLIAFFNPYRNIKHSFFLQLIQIFPITDIMQNNNIIEVRIYIYVYLIHRILIEDTPLTAIRNCLYELLAKI